ncbi:gastrula zinc finger protein XlCGF7.1-like isoform X2 [Salmo salar]|uniref:Gastrula zinc finger protein XlCGF7.1-like isoform X2 n=1 Tax=Salmo salar TaxID=8030 RepID=A0ABM3CK26_SALSA|nr:gastrula zinc finger protein XlCGF7.1-like isoform X2 [Salmo salar]
MDRDKSSPSPSIHPESPGRSPPCTLLLGLVDCRKTPGQSGTKKGEEEHGDLILLKDSCNCCSLSGRGLSSGEPQQHHDADKKEKSFSRSEHLKKHQHRAIGKKPHHCCSDCGKSFAKEKDLIIQKQIHTGEKPYHCSQFGKSFPASKTLKSHQRIHPGERPYTCFDCGKYLTQSGDLTTHQCIHTGEKPYSCDQCGKL